MLHHIDDPAGGKSDPRLVDNEFLTQITSVVEQNITNEQFGVAEMADQMHMSRSNLLRKVKKETTLSVSQFISQIRLKRAMELLKHSNLNVSEISHQVGFSSTSYFIKCFREFYGYPPGEVAKRAEAPKTPSGEEKVNEETLTPPTPSQQKVSVSKVSQKRMVWIAGVAASVIFLTLLLYFKSPSVNLNAGEKSIVVLPFKNESSDSANLYLINGLMESTLNNLQKIKDLKVISRTSSEKYRDSKKSIPEMAKELNAGYFVEGSGQKVGDKILLNIQLIEGKSDKHLWAKQYRRESTDIFALQEEIAKDIAEEIQVIITPEEELRIQQKLTDNLEAYDCFLKGRDFASLRRREDFEKAIVEFKKAIAKDKNFAAAYAEVAITYYYMDLFQKDKLYGVEINTYADKAVLLDPTLPSSLAAKALFYMHKQDYRSALPYLEKALEYSPNSVMIIYLLADIHNNYIPNTGKYLEYALMAVERDGGADSITASYNYLHLANALVQSGFIDESLNMVNRSLSYNAQNHYAKWVKSFILMAKDKDLNRTRALLVEELQKDTTKIHLVEEVGKVCYLMRDFKTAYQYYRKFLDVRDAYGLDLYKHEALKFAIVFSKMGHKKEGEQFAEEFREYVEKDETIYKSLNLAGYYAFKGRDQEAIEQMKIFRKQNNFQYWVLLLRADPIADEIKDHPEFEKVMSDIENTFWKEHRKLRERLEEKGLLDSFRSAS